MFCYLLALTLYIATVNGQVPKRYVFLESASNVSVILGYDAYFICNGGLKWSFESDVGFAGREVGPHPAPSDIKKQNESIFMISTSYQLPPKHFTPTKVYTMRDDRGRLILRIDNASLLDAGTYRCHGEANIQDAFLSVHPRELFAVNRSSNLPAIPLAAGMIKFFKMFPSSHPRDVILHCPLTPAQRVLSWEWREPIPPDSELAAVLPRHASPSRTVSFNRPGIFSNDNVEIGPSLAWVRVIDPLSPEAPNKLWCKFEMADLWHGKRGHPSYYEIHWTLYEPFNVRVKLHNSTADPLMAGADSRGGVVDYSAVYGSLGLEREQTSHRDRMALLAEPKDRLIEGHPARLACIYRPLQGSQTAGRPVQLAAWYRGEDYRSLPQPPFHVNNTQEEGVSWLSVRAFPVSMETTAGSAGGGKIYEDSEWAQVPYEKITCVVNSLVDEENNYTVSSNASLLLEVIRQPRIIQTEQMSAEISRGDYVKLTCLTLANGKPNITIDFSATAGRRPDAKSSSTPSRLGYLGVLQTGSPEDVQMAGWRPLVESYRLKTYQPPVESRKPMLHKLVVDIRGALHEHHGTYRCRVSNAAGQAQHIGHLRVRSEPTLTIQPQQSTYYLARQPLIISCLVTGYPLAGTNLTSSLLTNRDEEDQLSPEEPPQIRMNPPDVERNSPVRLMFLKADRRRDTLVFVKLTDIRTGVYEGINTTYSVLINHRPQGEITARCEYTHIDGSVISDEMEIKEATPPSAPKVVALCSGPGAVIFGVTNPQVSQENEFTDKIVNQRVLFAPTANFHSASNLTSKIILLDEHGQPRSQKTVDGNEEEIQEEVLAQQAGLAMHNYQRQAMATIPLTNLQPGTNYTFEWSSANQFHLTNTIQIITETAPLTAPLQPTHFVFLIPTTNHLRVSVFLDDPCPYDNGGRAELNNILIRYRKATNSRGIGGARGDSKLQGYGNWSDTHACFLNQFKDPSLLSAELRQRHHQQVKWSGDSVVQCEVQVHDPHADLEVAVATMNRFGVSPWLPAIYQASRAVKAAYFYTTAASPLLPSTLLTFVLLVLLIQ